ncbi:MAG: threonine/homoserine/homoserine lactone efflux protein [Planctomycetota bacterium]|jgi:threonine/homoserine/homoserine lactone efflux protein
MPLDLYLGYLIACIVILSIPGPTILLVISYSISQGPRANIPLIAGVALGDTLAISLSLAGLGALLATSAFWFGLLKWLGGLYLIYLGIKLLRNKTTLTSIDPSIPPRSARALFTSSFVVTALNPKSIVFFVALLPQFISAGHVVTPQLWILGVSFVVLAICACSFYAMFANRLRLMLSTATAQRWFNGAGGSLLCVAGVWALMAKRVINAA